MTREELDKLWQKALFQSVAAGEKYARYHFAAMVAEREREACAKVCDEAGVEPTSRYPSSQAKQLADAIRARNEA
jgi:hypothetical protein